MYVLRANVVALTVLMIGLAFSGCAGGDATTVASTTVAPAPAPTVTDETGSITGLVLSDEGTPLVGADVGMADSNGTATKTDLTGRYTINDLEAGDYSLVAQKLGYEASGKRATVVAGETIEVGFTLVAIALESEPHVDYKIREGIIAGTWFYSFAVTYRPVQTFPINFTKGAQDVVLSLAWLANSPTSARYMYQNLAYDGDQNSTWGKSPLTVRLSEIEVEKAKDKATATWYLHFACSGSTLTPQCFIDNPEAFVPVVVQDQRVTFYHTVFYNQAAPDGYTGLPA